MSVSPDDVVLAAPQREGSPRSDRRARVLRAAAGPGIAVALALVALALSWRVNVEYLTQDGAYYLNLARELAAGHGYVSRVLWLVWLAPPALPFPYGNPGGPLYSTILSFAVGHSDLFRSAVLLNVATFAALVALVYRFARQAGATPPWAGFGAGWTALSALLVRLTFMPVSDVLAATLGFAALTVAGGGRTKLRAPLAGALCGLAYLARYQMLAVLPGVLLALALHRGLGDPAQRRRALGRDVALVLGAALLVVSPWVVRNLLVFHAPNYSYASKYFVLLGFENTGLDPVTLWNSVTPPPPETRYVLGHLPQYLFGTFWRAKEALLMWPLDGSLLSGLSLVGIWAARRRAWLAGAYLALAITTGFFVVTYLDVRYLLLVVPVAGALAAVGMTWLVGQLRVFPFGVLAAAVLALSITSGQLFASFQVRKEQPRRPGITVALGALKHDIDARPDWAGPVMGGQTPEFLGWFLGRSAVSFPLGTNDEWWAVARRYGVKLLVITPDEEQHLESASWREQVKPGLRVVWTDPKTGLTAYELPPAP